MLQNLKVDIIYHLSNSDFEMEFNMCGCCRMRLLSDKTADRKSLIGALSRAVSRSRIIIACGPLFSADGLIATVATAIGSKTVAVNNAAYGINGDETINIIAGSTPLVTPDGYFGGCIIESGPQTIILLTENRAFRKTIMQTLIHPYIEEMSVISLKEKPAIVKTQSEEAVPEPIAADEVQSDHINAEELSGNTNFEPASMEIVEEPQADEETTVLEEAEEQDIEEEAIDELETEPQEIAEESKSHGNEQMQDGDAEHTVEAEVEPIEDAAYEADDSQAGEVSDYIVKDDMTEPAAEREIPFVFDDKNGETEFELLSQKIDNTYDTMYIEPERPKHSHTDKYAASYTPTEENDSFLSDAEYSAKVGGKKSAITINIPIIILTVILLVIVGLLCYFLIVVPRLQNISTVEYLRDIFGTVNTTVYL